MTNEKIILLIDQCKKYPDEANRETAIHALGEYLYENLKRFKLDYLNEDSRSDFITWLYPRFGAIIDQYDASRAAFTTYLTWVVRLSWKTFWRSQYSRDACQRVLETEEFTNRLSIETEMENSGEWNAETADRAENYGTLPRSKVTRAIRQSRKRREMDSRKIFLLACKAGNFLDETAVGKIARRTGYDEEYVRKTLGIIHERCKLKRERMQFLREQQNICYIRAQKCLYEMKYLERESNRYLALEREYRYCVVRLEKLRSRSSRQIRSPSNRFLATTLGMSRGTVDATLAAALKHGYSDEP